MKPPMPGVVRVRADTIFFDKRLVFFSFREITNMKKLLVIAIVSAQLAACATQHASEPPAAAPVLNIAESRSLYVYAQARLHMINDDFEGALALLHAAVEADPKSAYLHLAVATVYSKMNRLPEALAACEEAIKLDPNNFDAQMLAGNLLLALKRDREAIVHYKKAKELKP